jgi:hypothetical protein
MCLTTLQLDTDTVVRSGSRATPLYSTGMCLLVSIIVALPLLEAMRRNVYMHSSAHLCGSDVCEVRCSLRVCWHGMRAIWIHEELRIGKLIFTVVQQGVRIKGLMTNSCK